MQQITQLKKVLVANRGEGEYIRLSIDSGNYREKRASLDADIDRVLGEIMALLGGKNEG